MRNTEQTLSTAIGELSCVSTHRPASLSELTALSVVQGCIDELLRSCVDELRADPQVKASWSAIAYALGVSPDVVRRQYGSGLTATEEQVASFWGHYAERFTWDFLPTDFLHALYVRWMSTRHPDDVPFEKKALARRLKAVVTASGEWARNRSRPGVLMSAPEPLAKLVPHWSPDDSGDCIYGFRRSATMQGRAGTAASGTR